jgi:hypothetical protein
MKKKPGDTTIDKKDKLDPMADTSNYAAGNEGEDILPEEDDKVDLEIDEDDVVHEPSNEEIEETPGINEDDYDDGEEDDD